MTTAIVIPTHNNVDTLIQCLESILDCTRESTPHSNYRVVVVDNGSTDQTPTYLRDVTARYPQKVTVLRQEENLGFVDGTNAGLRAVQANENVLLLNDDTQITDPLWLDKLASLLNGDVGAVGPVTNHALGLQNLRESYRLPATHPVKFLIGFCLLIRADAFQQVGLLDPQFAGVMNDDLDYSLRLRAAGYSLKVDRTAFVMHYGSTSTGRDGAQAFMDRQAEGRNRLVAKWGQAAVDDLFQIALPVDDLNRDVDWEHAFEIIQPLSTESEVGGAWPEIRQRKCYALFDMARRVDRGCILELGTYRGLGAVTLALGAQGRAKVYSLDDYATRTTFNGATYTASDAELARQAIQRANVPVTLLNGEARQMAETWHEPIGLLFWDLGMYGSADDPRIKEDFLAWEKHVLPGGHFVAKHLPNFDPNWFTRQGWVFDVVYEGNMYVFKKTLGTAIWIVDGEKYLAEAKRSAEQVNRVMPELSTFVVDAKSFGPREHSEWYIDANRYLHLVLNALPEGEKVLFLDSDTYMAFPVPELFNMLDRFDLALAQAPGHHTAPTVEPLPDAFPEFNIGVVAMRNNPQVRDLWQEVYRQQVAHSEVYGNNDQSALREVLWNLPVVEDRMEIHPPLRYAVLPNEYNCRFNFGCQVRDLVRILHGHAANYDEIVDSLNAGYRVGNELPPRLWHPLMLAQPKLDVWERMEHEHTC